MLEIEEQSQRGGEILNCLYQKCTCGNPVIKNMFTKILFCCHRVFFHQLNAWIVHGQLVDICEEFFIHKINHGDGQQTGVKTTISNLDNEKQLNMTKLSANTMSNVNMIGSILSMAAEFGASDNFGELSNESVQSEWSISYTLRISMLPHCYIS